jgi:6-phosphogluconolactonase (cycloisomerase 2 family)
MLSITRVSACSAAVLALLVSIWGCMNGSVLNALKAAEAGPAAPKSIGIVVGSGQATISWPAVQGAESYNLYWAAGTSVSVSSGTKIPNAVSPQTITGLSNGTQYAFMVTSVNNYRESAAGTLAAVIPGAAPAAPAISSRTPGERQVTVNWPTVAGATSYNLYWKQGSAVDTSTGTKIAGATSPQIVNDPSITDGTQYSFIVTAVDSFGESAASAAVNATTNLYALYASNYGSAIAAFAMNSKTGALTAVSGSPYTASGANTLQIVVDPTGHFVYMVDGGSDEIFAYTINQATGGLVTIPGSPYSTPVAYPDEIAMDPTGRFLYVGCYTSGNNIQIYSITPGSGALASIGSAAFSALDSVTVDPSGKFLYVTSNAVSNNIGDYSLNTSSGVTSSLIQYFTMARSPNFLVIDPLDRFAYVAEYTDNNLHAYSIASTGPLTEISGSPVSNGGGYDEAAIDPTSKFLYVSNYLNASVSAYSIDQTSGLPTQIGVYGTGTGSTPQGVAVDPTGKFVYVGNTANNCGISGFSINPATGALTALSGQPFGGSTTYDFVAVATIVTP